MDDLLIFMSKGGITLHLRRVASRHVARIIAKHPIPEPPTYTFTAAGGVLVTKAHDKDSLETPEDHASWNAYTKARSAAIEAQNLAIVRFLLYQCVIEEPPPVEQWSVDFGLWKLDVPDVTDPVLFKQEWLESEVLIDPDDYSAFISRLYRLGGLLKDDQAEEFEQFFRLTLARLSAT